MAAVFRLLLLPLLLTLALPAAAQKTTEPQETAPPGAEPPKPRAAPIVTVEMMALPRSGGVLVFGGTHGAGLEAVKNLVAMKQQVTVVTDGSDDATLKSMGATIARGNALDPKSLEEVFKATPYRIVISALSREGDAPSPDFEGNKNVIDAAKAIGIPRFILVSTIGAGDSAKAVNWIGRLFYKTMFADKTRAEEYLKASGLDYTIIRPGGLLDKAPSGQARLVEDSGSFSWIAHPDVGKLIAASVEDEKAIKKVYAAVDPTRESILSLVRD